MGEEEIKHSRGKEPGKEERARGGEGRWEKGEGKKGRNRGRRMKQKKVEKTGWGGKEIGTRGGDNKQYILSSLPVEISNHHSV